MTRCTEGSLGGSLCSPMAREERDGRRFEVRSWRLEVLGTSNSELRTSLPPHAWPTATPTIPHSPFIIPNSATPVPPLPLGLPRYPVPPLPASPLTPHASPLTPNPLPPYPRGLQPLTCRNAHESCRLERCPLYKRSLYLWLPITGGGCHETGERQGRQEQSVGIPQES